MLDINPTIVIGLDVQYVRLDDDLIRHNLSVYRGDHHDLPQRHIVAVLDSNPEVIIAATTRGIDGVIWDQPHNQKFSWHFRAHPDDVLAGLLRRFKEWKGRYTNEHQCSR